MDHLVNLASVLNYKICTTELVFIDVFIDVPLYILTGKIVDG